MGLALTIYVFKDQLNLLFFSDLQWFNFSPCCSDVEAYSKGVSVHSDITGWMWAVKPGVKLLFKHTWFDKCCAKVSRKTSSPQNV